MNEIKEKYLRTLNEVYKILGKYAKRDIEDYVTKLERDNLGLRTTAKNLQEQKEKMMGYIGGNNER